MSGNLSYVDFPSTVIFLEFSPLLDGFCRLPLAVCVCSFQHIDFPLWCGVHVTLQHKGFPLCGVC